VGGGVIPYTDFVGGLNLTLTSGQVELVRVAFDGKRPTAGLATAQRIWGHEFAGTSARPSDVAIPPESRKVVGAVCGRGSGKSLIGGTRVLHLACTVDLSRLRPREIAFCPVIAPDLDTAQQVVRFALGAAEQLGLSITQRDRGGDAGFTIARKGGKKVRIVARSASAKGASVRGRSMPCAVLDEACFFRDATYKVNDQDIFDALIYRIMAGGQILILSSPWMESGLLYNLWRRNFNHPVDALIAHAPTSLMRTDDPAVISSIESERRIDPEKCARERDAEFMTSNAKAFFDPRALGGMLTDDEPIMIKGSTRAVGGDFAFQRNATSFVAAQLHETPKGQVYEVTDIYEKVPHGEPLKPSEICADAAKFAKEVEVDEIVSDGHYRETIAEHLHNAGIVRIDAPAGTTGKSDVYQVARTLINEGQVKLPIALKGDAILPERLIRQLRETVSRPLPGGGVTIDSPTWRTGEHGDIASAFVLAIWRTFKLGWRPSATTADDQKREAAYAAGIDELERDHMRRALEEDLKANRFRNVLQRQATMGNRRLFRV
jgi:hypothetical protein